MQTIEDWYGSARETLKLFDGYFESRRLVGRAKADHLCYKCGSRESFESIRRLLEENSLWVHQSPIAGRRIALARLNRPLETVLGQINLIELSDQKPDGSQSDGFDHVEIYATDGDYDALVRYFEQLGESVRKVERPHHVTHDIKFERGLIVRLTQGPLAEKVKSEMV